MEILNNKCYCVFEHNVGKSSVFSTFYNDLIHFGFVMAEKAHGILKFLNIYNM